MNSIIGKPLDQVDTPALWVDLDLMEQNIQQLAGYMKAAGVGWRPHTKGIKIPAIAHKLIEAGALGITCAKLGEAEVMANAGIHDILIANQIVGEIKVRRLANLRRQADVIVAVDDLSNVHEIAHIACEYGVKIRVVIEINSGMNRCGLAPGQPVLDFAKQIRNLPGIELAGLMAWEGHVVQISDPKEKLKKTQQAVSSLVETARLCRTAGFPIPIVSCGGTGSYTISAHIPGVTEIQAGGGIFGDITYRGWGAGTECSLFIHTTVVSHPTVERAVVDAGRKTMSSEHNMPEVKDIPGAKLTGLSAEHGTLALEPPATALCVGDKINFIVGYGDFTVFMHDRLYGVRRGRVEVVWDIQGRGKLT